MVDVPPPPTSESGLDFTHPRGSKGRRVHAKDCQRSIPFPETKWALADEGMELYAEKDWRRAAMDSTYLAGEGPQGKYIAKRDLAVA